MPAPAVSVLVVSWQSGPWLERCLRSIDPAAAEIIVADNASTDGSVERAAAAAPHARVLALPSNLGFAGGVNAARREAHAPRLLLLNPDAAATPGAIARLAEVLDSHPDLGAVSGRLVDAQGADQLGFNVRRLPTLASLTADLLYLRYLWPTNPVSARYYAADFDPDASGEVEQPAAACLMVRADVFDRLGGFDEVFWPAWWEDVDFCRRLRDAGYRIRYVADARFLHAGGSSLEALGKRAFLEAFTRNRQRYVRKHYGAAAAGLMGVLSRLSLNVRLFAMIVRRARRSGA